MKTKQPERRELNRKFNRSTLASFWIPSSGDTESPQPKPKGIEKMNNQQLISVQGPLYLEMCQNAVPQTDDQSALLKTHKRAATAKRSNYVIKKVCFDSLTAMQPGDDEQVTDDQVSKQPGENDDQVNDGQPGEVENDDQVNDDQPGQVENQNDEVPMTLVQAVRQLDHTNDDHWTKSGQPAMKAVEAIFGSDVSRSQIDEVAPGYDREAAATAAE